MADIAVKRNNHAGPVDSLRDLRSRNTDYSAMPTFPGKHRDVGRLTCSVTAFQLNDCARHNLFLHLLALLISAIEMLRQPACFFLISRIEQFDNCACGIHSARSVYPWPNTKA